MSEQKRIWNTYRDFLGEDVKLFEHLVVRFDFRFEVHFNVKFDVCMVMSWITSYVNWTYPEIYAYGRQGTEFSGIEYSAGI